MHRITADTYACLVGQTPVLLDIKKGRYSLARGATGRRITALLEACSNHSAGRILPAPIFSHIPKPAGQKKQSSWRLIFFALLSLCAAILEVRRTSLQQLVRELEAEAGKPARPSKFPVSEEVVAAAFHRIQALLPLENLCLPRSMAIVRILRRCGHSPTLVIGVRLPIAAHCWVQCDDRVIGDTVERVDAFEPILAI